MSNVELTMTLKNAQLIAGLNAQLERQNRNTEAIQKTTKATKDQTHAVDDLIRELKIEQQLEDQISEHQKRNSAARIAQLKAEGEALRRSQAPANFAAGYGLSPSSVMGAVPPHLRSMAGVNPMAPFRNGQAELARRIDAEKRLALITSDMGAGANMASGALSGVNMQLLGLVGTAFTLASAWQAVKAAEAAYQQKSEESRAFNVSLGSTQANALLNLTGLSSARKQQVLTSDIPGIQKATGFPDQQALVRAVESGFIAGDDIDLSLKATRSAAQLTRLNPDQLPTYSGAAVDIMRASGETDADKALGFLLQVNSRVGDPRKQAENLPPGITAAALSAEGDDNKEAARWAQAVFTSLSRTANDTEGDRTRTATQQFFTGPGGMREFFKDRKDDPGSVGGRLKLLQDNKKLRDEFLEGFGGEGRFKMGYEKMLTPGDLAQQGMNQAYGKVNFQSETLNQIIREQGSTGSLQAGGAAATAKANQETLMTTKEGRRRAIQEQARQIGIESMNSTASTWGDSIVGTAEQSIGRYSRRAVGYDEIENSLHVLRGTAYGGTGAPGRGFFADMGGRDDLLRSARASGDTEGIATYGSQLKYLQQQIALLEDLKKQLAELNASNARMANEPKAAPAPAAPRPGGGRR